MNLKKGNINKEILDIQKIKIKVTRIVIFIKKCMEKNTMKIKAKVNKRIIIMNMKMILMEILIMKMVIKKVMIMKMIMIKMNFIMIKDLMNNSFWTILIKTLTYKPKNMKIQEILKDNIMICRKEKINDVYFNL